MKLKCFKIYIGNWCFQFYNPLIFSNWYIEDYILTNEYVFTSIGFITIIYFEEL